MKVELLMIGKISDKPYQKLIQLYMDRCSNKMPVELIHCRNTDEMVRRVSGKSHVIAMEEHARCYDTNGFHRWLEQKINSGINRITICLGAADGVPAEVKKAASESISLSPLTMNHQLALLVMTEQIYRVISIMFGEPYHKA